MKRALIIVAISGIVAAALFIRWCNYSDDFIPRQRHVVNTAGDFVLAAPPPTARTEAGAATVGDRVYLAGGIDAFARTLKSFEMYDAATDRWTVLPDVPQPVNHPGVCAVGNRIYVIGGFGPLGIRIRGAMLARWDPLRSVHIYDTQSRTWTAGSPLPEPRGAGGVATSDGAVWYVGGINQQRQVSADLFRLDPVGGKWERMQPMSIARDHLRLESVGGALFAIAGRKDDLRHNYTANEKYDIATGRWARAADIPVGRGGMGSVVMNGLIYTFGGEHLWKCLENIERYNPATDTWQISGRLPEARHGICAATINGRIHLISGGRRPRVSVSDIHRVFVPAESK